MRTPAWTVECRSAAEFYAALGPLRARRRRAEWRAASRHRGIQRWGVRGRCGPCGRDVEFSVENVRDDWDSVYREYLACPLCGLSNRQRFVASYVMRHGGDVYMYEYVTELYAFLSRRARLTGSEYLGPGYPGGRAYDGVRHEDAGRLSFADCTFDLAVSSDVFEHVPDIGEALSECCRILRPGGRMLATFPFFRSTTGRTVRRARLEGDTVRHLLPEQYHGNPLSEKGSLVFYDYGWDFLDTCREAGFSDAYALAYYDARLGHVGQGAQLAWVGVK